MKNRVVYIISSFIFLVMLAIAIPFHLDVTNQIVGKQMEERDIQGLFLGDRRERKFQPREYIQKRNAINETEFEELE
ncbi:MULTISPECIES: hypothetical protein [Bacillaceae]|uniref:Uncharacterized protein n=1 Tax=Evansella alkalicola TaxID=745819 RepID=A0ABS6JVL9_9BACI|nr:MULTISPECIES: hypothetical protein [Bacillaceae]MBU9722538.1 hypothetical protein [Bacillus alkalicola]